jgi:hypothetical protein
LLCLLLTGCHALRFGPLPPPEKLDRAETKDPSLALPNKFSVRVSQYVFLSNFELKRDLPLFRELDDLREQVYRELELPGANVLVQVYVFEDRERYERFMKARYPDLPKRRAFFVAQPRGVGSVEDLLVYTYWGTRIREDLRHELTHALLHSVLRDVPLWLDEGLAEFFEVPPEWHENNPRHVEQLRHSAAGVFRADLAHLEQLSQVQQMTPAEYREAWAWVHFMLKETPAGKAILTGYLQQLRTTPTPGPLYPRLAKAFPDMEDALNRHLAKLDATAPEPPTAKP